MTADFDGVSERPIGERVRRGSSVSSTASVRRKRGEVKSGLAMTSHNEGNGRKKRISERPRTPESDDGVRLKSEDEVFA